MLIDTVQSVGKFMRITSMVKMKCHPHPGMVYADRPITVNRIAKESEGDQSFFNSGYYGKDTFGQYA